MVFSIHVQEQILRPSGPHRPRCFWSDYLALHPNCTVIVDTSSFVFLFLSLFFQVGLRDRDPGRKLGERLFGFDHRELKKCLADVVLELAGPQGRPLCFVLETGVGVPRPLAQESARCRKRIEEMERDFSGYLAMFQVTSFPSVAPPRLRETPGARPATVDYSRINRLYPVISGWLTKEIMELLCRDPPQIDERLAALHYSFVRADSIAPALVSLSSALLSTPPSSGAVCSRCVAITENPAVFFAGVDVCMGLPAPPTWGRHAAGKQPPAVFLHDAVLQMHGLRSAAALIVALCLDHANNGSGSGGRGYDRPEYENSIGKVRHWTAQLPHDADLSTVACHVLEQAGLASSQDEVLQTKRTRFLAEVDGFRTLLSAGQQAVQQDDHQRAPTPVPPVVLWLLSPSSRPLKMEASISVELAPSFVERLAYATNSHVGAKVSYFDATGELHQAIAAAGDLAPPAGADARAWAAFLLGLPASSSRASLTPCDMCRLALSDCLQQVALDRFAPGSQARLLCDAALAATSRTAEEKEGPPPFVSCHEHLMRLRREGFQLSDLFFAMDALGHALLAVHWCVEVACHIGGSRDDGGGSNSSNSIHRHRHRDDQSRSLGNGDWSPPAEVAGSRPSEHRDIERGVGAALRQEWVAFLLSLSVPSWCREMVNVLTPQGQGATFQRHQQGGSLQQQRGEFPMPKGFSDISWDD